MGAAIRRLTPPVIDIAPRRGEKLPQNIYTPGGFRVSLHSLKLRALWGANLCLRCCFLRLIPRLISRLIPVRRQAAETFDDEWEVFDDRVDFQFRCVAA